MDMPSHVTVTLGILVFWHVNVNTTHVESSAIFVVQDTYRIYGCLLKLENLLFVNVSLWKIVMAFSVIKFCWILIKPRYWLIASVFFSIETSMIVWWNFEISPSIDNQNWLVGLNIFICHKQDKRIGHILYNLGCRLRYLHDIHT